MLASVTRLILTSFLIIFLIGGGRVCGCETLSWIGIDCHKSAESETCHHHHHDGGEEDDSQSPEPEDCCEQSLKLVNGEIPKTLSVPEISGFGELAPVSLLEINPLVGLIAKSLTRWMNPPSHFPTLGLSRLFQQRFNV